MQYSADATCPSAAEFESAVRERVRRVRLARQGEIAREYRVTVRQAGAQHVARLEFVDANGKAIAREVAADECTSAVRAIALVTALAIDAVVPEEHGAPSVATGEPQRAPASAPQPAPNADTAARPEPKPLPAPAEQKRAEPPTARTSRPAAAWRPDFELGARATLTTPKAPRALFGAELFGALESPSSAWLVQLGIAGERGTLVRINPGQARFNFVGGRLEGCALRLALGSRFSAMPCALIEAGATIAEGFIDESRTVIDPWVATGPSGRLRWQWGRGSAVLEAGALFPLTYRDRLVFGDVDAPQAEVHEIPLLGAFAALGVAIDL